MKACTRCGETKPLDEFTAHPKGAQGRRSWCKRCTADYMRTKRAQPGGMNRDSAYVRARMTALQELAARHPDEYDAILTQARVAEGLSPIPYDRSGAA